MISIIRCIPSLLLIASAHAQQAAEHHHHHHHHHHHDQDHTHHKAELLALGLDPAHILANIRVTLNVTEEGVSLVDDGYEEEGDCEEWDEDEPTEVLSLLTSSSINAAPTTVAPMATFAAQALATTSLAPSSDPTIDAATTSSSAVQDPVTTAEIAATTQAVQLVVLPDPTTAAPVDVKDAAPTIPVIEDPVPVHTPAPAPAPAPAPVPSTSLYNLIRTHAGSSFFDRFYFFTDSDPTHGAVTYVGQSDAMSSGLAYTTDVGTTIMKVDNSSYLDLYVPRRSVRIQSSDTYEVGSVIILDAASMPFGQTTWPAFWSNGPDWPNGGEIDIYEGTHNDNSNLMTLHTGNGCYLATPMAGLGSARQSTDCYAYTNSNTGCGIADYDPSSYGAGFKAAGGGIFVMKLSSDGISVWRFMRGNIPADITANTIDPNAWGTPMAFWSSSSCDINRFFRTQTIIFDITLCGDLAGATFSPDQNNGKSCLEAVQDPSNYANAYFEINSLKVFSLAG